MTKHAGTFIEFSFKLHGLKPRSFQAELKALSPSTSDWLWKAVVSDAKCIAFVAESIECLWCFYTWQQHATDKYKPINTNYLKLILNYTETPKLKFRLVPSGFATRSLSMFFLLCKWQLFTRNKYFESPFKWDFFYGSSILSQIEHKFQKQTLIKHLLQTSAWLFV